MSRFYRPTLTKFRIKYLFPKNCIEEGESDTTANKRDYFSKK